MKKINNTLIKRKKIIALLREHGINRVNQESVHSLEEAMKEYLSKIFLALKEEMVTHGRNTLKSADVQSVLAKMKKEESFEI